MSEASSLSNSEPQSPLVVLHRRLGLIAAAAIVGAVCAVSLGLLRPPLQMAQATLAVGFVPADPLGRPGDRAMPLASLEEVQETVNSAAFQMELYEAGAPADLRVRAEVMGTLVRVTATSRDTAAVRSGLEKALARVEQDHRSRLDQWQHDSSDLLASLSREASATPEASSDSRAAEIRRLSAALQLARGPAYTRPTTRIAAVSVAPRKTSLAKYAIAGGLSALIFAWLLVYVQSYRRSTRPATVST